VTVAYGEHDDWHAREGASGVNGNGAATNGVGSVVAGVAIEITRTVKTSVLHNT
jgi:hypothetical protein